MQERRDPWFRFRRDDGGRALLRLFCLPYAGGGASIYRNWPAALAPAVDAVAVQLPGREDRLGERAFTRVEPLCAALAPHMAPLLDRPFALFGHSMGAIVAYELARLFEARGTPVAHLIVSGQRGPQVPLGRRITHDLPPDAFQARLRELAGTPEAVLADPDIMALLTPMLRSDFELSETYDRRQRPPLRCPVTVLGGSEDAETSRADLEAWRTATEGPVRVEMVPGGHFFVHSAAADVLRAVSAALA